MPKRKGQAVPFQHRARIHILTLLVALATGAPAVVQAQAVISNERNVVYRLPGREEFERLGRAVVGLDDIDRDGVPDFAASGAKRERENRPSRAFVDVFSGARGKRLYTIYAPPDEPHFGLDLKAYQDLDGDGFSEILISNIRTTIWIYSGYAGRLLRRIRVEQARYASHLRIASDHDLNGDGLADLVLSDAGRSRSFHNAGRAACLDLAEGTRILWDVDGKRANRLLGLDVVVVSDQNGDGTADVLTTEGDRPHDLHWGLVLDGKSGRTLRTIGERERYRVFGSEMANLSDLTGDGLPEVAVSTTVPRRESHLEGVGQVLVLDGATLETLRTHRGLTPAHDFGGFTGDRLGRHLLSMPDLDGDGIGEYVAVAEQDGGLLVTASTHLYLYSGRTGAILNVLEKRHAPSFSYVSDISYLGDINADGRPEFLASSSKGKTISFVSGVVRPIFFDLESSVPFLRGDANWDGQVDLADAIAIATQVFFEEFDLRCPVILDVNGDDFVTATDVSTLAYYLFRGEGRPAAPYPHCAPLLRLWPAELERYPCTESNCQ